MGSPPFSSVVRDDLLRLELAGLGSQVAPSALTNLPPAARAELQEGKDSWWIWLVGRDAWKVVRQGYDEAITLADLSPEDLEPVWRRMDDMDTRWSYANPLTALALPPLQLQYAHWSHSARTRMDGLIAVIIAGRIREDRGHWPADLSELVSSPEAAALDGWKPSPTAMQLVRSQDRVGIQVQFFGREKLSKPLEPASLTLWALGGTEPTPAPQR
jgi:hypothetical protein